MDGFSKITCFKICTFDHWSSLLKVKLLKVKVSMIGTVRARALSKAVVARMKKYKMLKLFANIKDELEMGQL